MGLVKKGCFEGGVSPGFSGVFGGKKGSLGQF